MYQQRGKKLFILVIANIVDTYNTVDVAERGDSRRTISDVITRDAVDDKNEKRRVEKTAGSADVHFAHERAKD